MPNNISPNPYAQVRATSSTSEFGFIVGVVDQTIRASVCRTGNYLGLFPTKLPNGRLRWDTEDIQRLLSGEVLTRDGFPDCRTDKDDKNPLVEAASVPAVKGSAK